MCVLMCVDTSCMIRNCCILSMQILFYSNKMKNALGVVDKIFSIINNPHIDSPKKM